MLKKIIPILAVLLVIGVFSANYVYNNNSDANLSDSNIEDVATIGVDTLLNTATSDNTDDVYDKIIENKDMNKNNIITNTLSNTNKINYVNSEDLNNSISINDYNRNISVNNKNNSFITTITPAQALKIVQERYDMKNFTGINLNNHGQYVVSYGNIEIFINSRTGKMEGGFSANGTALIGDDYVNNINSSNSSNYNITYNDGTNINLLNNDSYDKFIQVKNASYDGKSSYTTSITPNQALNYALREYPYMNFTSVDITNYGDYVVSDNQTSIYVNTQTGHIDGGYSVNEAPGLSSEVQAINNSNIAQNTTHSSDDSVQVNDTAFNSTDSGSAVNDTPIGEIVSNASDFVNSVNDSIDPADKA